MSSYYVELDNDLGEEAEAFRESRHSRRTRKPAARKNGSDHYPATDADAKALIERLGHFVWDTHKVRGRYSSAPYTLVAVVDGMQHSIHLPGRTGTTLMWLKGRLEKEEQKK